jgi:hypothetical protein
LLGVPRAKRGSMSPPRARKSPWAGFQGPPGSWHWRTSSTRRSATAGLWITQSRSGQECESGTDCADSEFALSGVGYAGIAVDIELRLSWTRFHMRLDTTRRRREQLLTHATSDANRLSPRHKCPQPKRAWAQMHRAAHLTHAMNPMETGSCDLATRSETAHPAVV